MGTRNKRVGAIHFSTIVGIYLLVHWPQPIRASPMFNNPMMDPTMGQMGQMGQMGGSMMDPTMGQMGQMGGFPSASGSSVSARKVEILVPPPGNLALTEADNALYNKYGQELAKLEVGEGLILRVVDAEASPQAGASDAATWKQWSTIMHELFTSRLGALDLDKQPFYEKRVQQPLSDQEKGEVGRLKEFYEALKTLPTIPYGLEGRDIVADLRQAITNTALPKAREIATKAIAKLSP